MQGQWHQYDIITELTKKYSHSTYLASPTNEPERQAVIAVFALSLFHDQDEREKMLSKAERIRELKHHYLLPILDIEVQKEQLFVVHEYLPKGSLRHRLKSLSSQRLELHEALTLVSQVGQALQYVHQHHIIHGNIKPENILFGTDGQTLLTDFNLVSRNDIAIRDHITEEYAFCYLAPEQFAGEGDAKSDQYALGCLAYELIMGHLPFAAQSLASMMEYHTTTQPVPLSSHVVGLSPSIEAAVLKAMAKDPSDRYRDISAFLKAISADILPQSPVFPFLGYNTYLNKKRTLSSPPQPKVQQNNACFPMKFDPIPASEDQLLKQPQDSPLTEDVLIRENEAYNLPVIAPKSLAHPQDWFAAIETAVPLSENVLIEEGEAHISPEMAPKSLLHPDWFAVEEAAVSSTNAANMDELPIAQPLSTRRRGPSPLQCAIALLALSALIFFVFWSPGLFLLGKGPKAGTPTLSPITVSTTCSAPTINMKVLVIAADGKESDLPAIQQALNDLGTPYTTYVAAKTPHGLTPDKLSSDCHGYYQGIILTSGSLTYGQGTHLVSALSAQEWTNLRRYESAMGIREIGWYTDPSTDFGYYTAKKGIGTTRHSISTTLTMQGKSVFQYLNPGTTIDIQNVNVYQAKALTDGSTTPLLTDAQGNALAAIHCYSDGRQVLSLTFDSNPKLLHDIILSYGLINWVTSGLFLGERHIYLTPQVDDVLTDSAEWLPTTPCGTAVDNTGYTYRINGTDWQTISNWQTSKQSDPIFANLTLTLAFNGHGTVDYTPDTLTPAVIANQGQFYWLNNTYHDANMNNADYATGASEIQSNNDTAQNPLHLTNYSPASLVTSGLSGLNNANFLQAAHDNGIRYLVSGTPVVGHGNPSPNAGMYSNLQPSILIVPHRPTDMYYNVSTPADWVVEYNCMYASFWGHNLKYQQILDKESQMMLVNILRGDIDPYVFYQEHMRAYDSSGHTLLGDLLDATLQKYKQYYQLPLQSLMLDKLGQAMANRMQYDTARVTASIVPGVSITLKARKATTVPVTGLKTPGSETYGGQQISYITLAAGQSVTLPLT